MANEVQINFESVIKRFSKQVAVEVAEKVIAQTRLEAATQENEELKQEIETLKKEIERLNQQSK